MKPFIFYDIYYAPVKALDDKQAGKFFRMICDFLDGNQPETDGKDTPEFELYWESIVDDLLPTAAPRERAAGSTSAIVTSPFCPFTARLFPISMMRTAARSSSCSARICLKTDRRKRQKATLSSTSLSANASWTRASCGCRTARRAAARRRGAARRKSAPRPASTLRLFGKRTKTNGKPTGNQAPCKGERGYL